MLPLEPIGTKPFVSNTQFTATMDAFNDARNLNEVLKTFRAHFAIKSGIYHHIPAIGAYNYGLLNTYFTVNFPPEITKFYKSHSLGSEPGARYIFSVARHMWLSDMPYVDSIVGTNHERRAHIALELMGEAVVSPLFGPYHRRGYSMISFGKDKSFYDEAFGWQVQSLLQAMHIRYSMVVEHFNASKRLTARESEVLELLRFGKTNREIAMALGISPSTVGGYLKQIFLKLDVQDRVTAALRASSFSLIK